MFNNTKKSKICKVNYRKIYEDHYGQIPLDEEGRSYDIHHIDGNHNNNDISNLKAVTIQEHYDIHYAQGDYGACYFMAIRMKRSPEKISEIAREINLERIRQGTHNFVGDRNPNTERVANGTHNFLGDKNPSRIASKNGTHNLQGLRNPMHKYVANGTHPWLKQNGGGEIAKARTQRLLENGTHHFLTKNPNKIEAKCPHCGKVGGYSGMKRWHFDNCKLKT